jgi:hypothetical protein
MASLQTAGGYRRSLGDVGIEMIEESNRGSILRALNSAFGLAAVVALLAMVGTLRAETVPPGFSGSLSPAGDDPVGYWSCQAYQPGTTLSSAGLGFYGSGSMELLVESATGWQPEITLNWSPNEFSLTGDFAPTIVNWTALTSGTYIITSDGEPSLPHGGSGAAVASADSTSTSGMFSECMSFQAGQTCSFMAMPEPSSNSDLFALNVSAVPEPAELVAIAGSLGIGLPS